MKLFLLDSYQSTFRETSYDKTKDESLLGDITKKIINYDAYASAVSRAYRNGENLSSADALAVSGEEILLIEFKNQKLSRIEAKRIRKKAFDSLHLFLHLEGLGRLTMEEIKRRVSYVVLYGENDIPSFTRYQKMVAASTGTEVLPFGLEPYASFYKRILVTTAEEFHGTELYKGIQ
ncbi:MAG: hypothetical protein KBS81_09215 [Spirochaetales bacterium]|nr:hypothetical protein [Candidatus Physcosoma equi]